MTESALMMSSRHHDGIPQHLAALEDEIAELASSIDAACWRLLDAVRRFDEQEGWVQYGCLSCIQWLSWRLGWGPVAARERLRVAHLLPKLPTLSEALRLGQVSFTKVRAITRVATAESDAVWLDIARNSTGAQLEKIVRLTRRNGQLEEVLFTQDQHEHRQVRAHYDEDGMFVLTARLPADLGAVIEQALRKAEGPLHEHDRDLSCEQRRADALVTMAEGFLQGPTTDQAVQDHALHQVVVHVDAEVQQDAAQRGRSEIERLAREYSRLLPPVPSSPDPNPPQGQRVRDSVRNRFTRAA